MTEQVKETADLVGLPAGSAVLQMILNGDQFDVRMVLVGATEPDFNNPAHRVAGEIQKLLPGILAVVLGQPLNQVPAQDIDDRLALSFDPVKHAAEPIPLSDIACQMVGTVTPARAVPELAAPYLGGEQHADPYGNRVYQD